MGPGPVSQMRLVVPHPLPLFGTTGKILSSVEGQLLNWITITMDPTRLPEKNVLQAIGTNFNLDNYRNGSEPLAMVR